MRCWPKHEYAELIVGAPEIFGVDKPDDSAVVIKGRITHNPAHHAVEGRAGIPAP